MAASLSVFAVFCTAHYFWTLLQRPAALVSIFAATSIWKVALAAIYRFSVAVGISGMIFLGLKEVWFFLAGYRLGITYDDYLGFGSVVVTILLLRGFERTAQLAARQLSEAKNVTRSLRPPVVFPKRPAR